MELQARLIVKKTTRWCCRPRRGVLVATVFATCLLVYIQENNSLDKSMRSLLTHMTNFLSVSRISRHQSGSFNSFDPTTNFRLPADDPSFYLTDTVRLLKQNGEINYRQPVNGIDKNYSDNIKTDTNHKSSKPNEKSLVLSDLAKVQYPGNTPSRVPDKLRSDNQNYAENVNKHDIVDKAPLPNPTNSSVKVAENFKVIIILAYMHTGSTYTGNLLSQHPGTFYQYEALRNLQMATQAAGRVRFLNGTVVWLKQGEFVDYQLAADALDHMTSCRHERLDVLTLAANFQSLRNFFNKDVAIYFRCVDPMQRMRRARALFERQNSPIEFIRTDRIERCIHLLTNQCKQAKFRIWKFIRLTMDSAELFLKNYVDTSNLRIVHLVRDPRAMMDSQLRKNDMNVAVFSNFVNRTRYMCWRMLRDLKLMDDLKKRYTDVFYSLRYEDLVDDPLKISRDLFRFIGMEFGNRDERYVRENSIDHPYNSTDRAVVWRTHITQTHLDALNDLCDEVNYKLGYVRLDDIDDVRDLNVKVHL